MSYKDELSREYISQRDVFADLINLVVYQGKQVLKVENLQELDPLYDNRRRDVLKQAVVKKDQEKTYVIFGIESQTYADPLMPLRIMEYDVKAYRRQINEIKQRIKECGRKNQLKEGEFLSGIGKEEKIKPVITVLIYWSGMKWREARSLKEMMGEMSKEIDDLVNDYKLFIVEPCELEENKITECQSEVGKLLRILKYSQKEKKMLESMLDREYIEVGVDTAKMIQAYTKLPIEIQEQEEKVNMCKAVEDMIKHSEERGRLIGLEQGERKAELQTSKRMIADGLSDELIAKYVGLSIHKLQELRKG